MRSWIWRVIQTVLLSGYLASQFVMYSTMSSRINNALLRIENLERFLSGKEGAENIENSVDGFKDESDFVEKRGLSRDHEHTRLRRTIQVPNIDITALVKRLQNVEKRLVFVVNS